MVVPGRAGTSSMRWHSAALTDQGLRRERNEDSFLHLPAAGIHAVADGMGGHAAGDVASRLAIGALRSALADAASPATAAPGIDAAYATRRLADAFDAANGAILRHAAEHPECGGMGTTLTALWLLPSGAECVLAHIGDSRAYLVRGGAVQQLTRDHTWVQQQIDAGMLSPRAARHHRLSSVLSRVLGTDEAGRADTACMVVEPGDRLLLCTDGLTTMVEEADLRALLLLELPPPLHVRELVDAANLRGGADNITVVLLQAEAG